MAELRDDIAAYDAMRLDLESSSLSKWVVFHHKELIGTFDSFDDAAKEAVRRYGRGPYLIRQIGASAIARPASVLYQAVLCLRLNAQRRAEQALCPARDRHERARDVA
jgi:hypothetical protein